MKEIIIRTIVTATLVAFSIGTGKAYYNISPYVYCAGNPVAYVDPTGMDNYLVDSLGNITLAQMTCDSKDIITSSSPNMLLNGVYCIGTQKKK